MNALLICDDYWHPGKIAEDGTAPLVKQGFQFDAVTNAKDFRSDMLKHYPVVLLSKCNQTAQSDETPWETDSVQKAFIEFVKNGGGLVAVHSALDTAVLDMLIGCRFIDHPDECPVTVSPIKKHPVTEGIETFCETDEHYNIDIIAPDADILLASYSPGIIRAAGFVRTQGKGRICALTPGHNLQVWQNQQFQKLLANALRWVN